MLLKWKYLIRMLRKIDKEVIEKIQDANLVDNVRWELETKDARARGILDRNVKLPK